MRKCDLYMGQREKTNSAITSSCVNLAILVENKTACISPHRTRIVEQRNSMVSIEISGITGVWTYV